LSCTRSSTLPESTTTTLDACATADCLPDTICRDGECVAAESGRLALYLDSAAAPVGALQFQVDFGDSGAMFSHPAGRPACVPNPEIFGAIYADCDSRDDRPGACGVHIGFHPGELGLSVATLDAFDAPKLVATCAIVGEDLEQAVAAMRIELVEAVDGNLDPVKVELSKRLERD
jgi:hypothetical protein